MLGVLVYRLDRKGNDELLGSIGLVNGQLQAFPRNGSHMPSFIINNPTSGRPGQPPIVAANNPIGFLNNLRYSYTSPYLRCTEPQELHLP